MPRRRRARDLWGAVRQLGLSRTTVLRAKKKLDILHKKARTPSGWIWYWLREGQELPDHRLPSPPNLEPWLKPLREKYGKRAQEE